MADVTKSDIQDLSKAIQDLATHVDQRFDEVDKRFDQVDTRFEQVGQRFDSLEERIDAQEEKYTQILNTLDTLSKNLSDFTGEMRARDAKVDRLERWVQKIAQETGVQLED